MPLVCMNWAQLEVLACMFKFVTSRLDTDNIYLDVQGHYYLLSCSRDCILITHKVGGFEIH